MTETDFEKYFNDPEHRNKKVKKKSKKNKKIEVKSGLLVAR